MFPYWFLFAVFAAGAVQFESRHQADRRSAMLLGFAALLPLVMIGFRYQVGGDWEPYLQIFDDTRYLDFGGAIADDDPGYTVLNWLAKSVGAEIWLVNLLCAILFCWGLVTFCKEQPSPWLAFVMAVPYLIIVVAMGYARQGVAIGLIMAAIVAWDRGKLIRFVLCIGVAATFHKTAVVVLPLIALSSTKNRFITGAGVLIFAVLLYQSFLSESVDRLIRNYVDTGYSSQGAAIRVSMNIVPALIYLRYQDRFYLTDVQRRMWRYLSLAAIGTMVLLITTPSSTVIDRIALYLIPLQLFVASRMPLLFSKDGTPNGQMTLAVVAYAALLQFVWLNFAYHAEYWLPYQLWPLEGADVTPKIDR